MGIDIGSSRREQFTLRRSQVDCVSTGKNSIWYWPMGTIRGGDGGRGRGECLIMRSSFEHLDNHTLTGTDIGTCQALLHLLMLESIELLESLLERSGENQKPKAVVLGQVKDRGLAIN